MHPISGWTLLGLLIGSLLLWPLAPAERRRIRLVWAIGVVALALWLATGLPAAPPWIGETVLALQQVIGLHLAVILVFYVILRRFHVPGILVDLTVAAGYATIVVALLSRTGVNLNGIIATSAVLTAVIGFGLQDLLGNLAGGLALQIEQTIMEGDWIRTDQYFGQVRSVRVRHTALETPDGDTVLAPNSAITRSAVTVIGRTRPGGPIKHRKLVTFQMPYDGHNPSEIIAAVNLALAASPMDGIADTPAPRCVIVDYHPFHVQYGALVWMTRPGMEYLDISGVRERIGFALSRAGLPLIPISYTVDLHRPHGVGDSETADRLAALTGVEIFHTLKEDEARRLAMRIKKESFAAGEVILRQGDPGDSLYILRRGRVRILLNGGRDLTEQVACLSPGDIFGEMSLLTGESRSATVQAMDQVDCYQVGKADLSGLLSARPELAADISTVLESRQTGLAAARVKLGEEAEKQRMAGSHHDLLTRIRRYFEL